MTIEITKTDLHASRPWQAFIYRNELRIPLGSFKTKRAAQAEANEIAA